MSNVAILVHILRDYFKVVGGQGHDYLDNAGVVVHSWAKVECVICARSLIETTIFTTSIFL